MIIIRFPDQTRSTTALVRGLKSLLEPYLTSHHLLNESHCLKIPRRRVRIYERYTVFETEATVEIRITQYNAATRTHASP